jgi:glucokinase
VDQRGTRCLCGRVGCAGPRASGHAIAARLGITPAEVSAIANSGNVHAWSVIRKTTVLLGRAIGSALNLLNLPLVVIGGGIAELGPRYFNLLECAVRAETFPEIFACCRIEKARAGYGAGATGAALMARERFLDCVRTRSACE